MSFFSTDKFIDNYCSNYCKTKLNLSLFVQMFFEKTRCLEMLSRIHHNYIIQTELQEDKRRLCQRPFNRLKDDKPSEYNHFRQSIRQSNKNMMILSNRVKILIVAAGLFILKHYPVNASQVDAQTNTYASEEDYSNLTSRWVTASKTFNQLIWPERAKFKKILNEFSKRRDLGVTDSCKTSCDTIITGLDQNKLWALKFLDSSGRRRTGMAYGHTSDAGNLDECIYNDVVVNDHRINGKYCLLSLHLPLLTKDKVHPLHGIQFSLSETPLEGTVYDSVYSVFVEMMMYTPSGFKFGLCLPSSCSKESVEKFINEKLKGSELSATFDKYCDSIDEGFETHHIFFIALCVTYGLFVAFCTLWTWNREDDGVIDSFHQHWNVFHNTNKLFVETKDPVSKQISFFHGIRFIYQMAALVFHTIDIFPFLPTVYAVFYIREWPHWLLKQAYASIGFFVQIPFAISGFLTYVTMYPYFVSKKGKVSFKCLMSTTLMANVFFITSQMTGLLRRLHF